jgi:hypothetical protein
MSGSLLIEPLDVLSFALAPTSSSSSCVLRLSNHYPVNAAYKLKFAAPKEFTVRPSSGVLSPDQAVDVIITKLASHCEQGHAFSFLVEHFAVGLAVSAVSKEDWTSSMASVVKHRLRVSFK